MNNFLLQFQSDILDRRIVRPKNIETTAMGAAYLAGLAVGFWSDIREIRKIWQEDSVFNPDMDEEKRKNLYEGWKGAIGKILHKP